MEDVKKLLIAAGASALIMWAVGMLSQTILNIRYDLSLHLWKPTDSNWIITVLAYDAIVGLLVTFFYTIVRKSFSGPLIKRGLTYGFFVWLIGPAAYILFIYLMIQVPDSVVLLWLATNLIQYLTIGIAITKIWEHEIEEKH